MANDQLDPSYQDGELDVALAAIGFLFARVGGGWSGLTAFRRAYENERGRLDGALAQGRGGLYALSVLDAAVERASKA